MYYWKQTGFLIFCSFLGVLALQQLPEPSIRQQIKKGGFAIAATHSSARNIRSIFVNIIRSFSRITVYDSISNSAKLGQADKQPVIESASPLKNSRTISWFQVCEIEI